MQGNRRLHPPGATKVDFFGKSERFALADYTGWVRMFAYQVGCAVKVHNDP